MACATQAEIGDINSGTEAQIGLAGKRGWTPPPLANQTPRDRLQARDHRSLASLPEGIGLELSVSPSARWLLRFWIRPRSVPGDPLRIRLARLALCCDE
jgi:hypothetical protein